jgi:hypothetical protein
MKNGAECDTVRDLMLFVFWGINMQEYVYEIYVRFIEIHNIRKINVASTQDILWLVSFHIRIENILYLENFNSKLRT